ncbi:hypothetical protein U9M48_013702 [Paspalum notatum var. saurae]|uniref:Reverse transcriptase domain-containing protein n=1 Tax=Paspalum notatum var. saurae TaxID=547442 RepID=A0AAQ3WJT0_PASNO
MLYGTATLRRRILWRHSRAPPQATLDGVRGCGATDHGAAMFYCGAKHHNIYQKDQEYHGQRAKKQWAMMGDRNTYFFQKSRKNKIPFVITHDGHILTTNEQMAYFTNLFTSQLHDMDEQEPQNQEGQQPDYLNDAFTDSTPTPQEIWTTIKDMRNDAAPGPDGLNAAFYKVAWPWIAADVQALVTSFYQIGDMPPDINKTFTHYHSSSVPSIEEAFLNISAVVINGQPYTHFSAQRGIRQRCPLSPYLFVLAINELSISLQEAMQTEQIKDDLIVCGQTTLEEVTQQQRSMTLDAFRAKLTALKANTLSHAGRLVYINLVLASIPIYYMTNILLPQDIMDKITAIIRNFWWKGQQDEGSAKTICFRAWDDICQPKNLGLGIKTSPQ